MCADPKTHSLRAPDHPSPHQNPIYTHTLTHTHNPIFLRSSPALMSHIPAYSFPYRQIQAVRVREKAWTTIHHTCNQYSDRHSVSTYPENCAKRTKTAMPKCVHQSLTPRQPLNRIKSPNLYPVPHTLAACKKPKVVSLYVLCCRLHASPCADKMHNSCVV